MLTEWRAADWLHAYETILKTVSHWQGNTCSIETDNLSTQKSSSRVLVACKNRTQFKSTTCAGYMYLSGVTAAASVRHRLMGCQKRQWRNCMNTCEHWDLWILHKDTQVYTVDTCKLGHMSFNSLNTAPPLRTHCVRHKTQARHVMPRCVIHHSRQVSNQKFHAHKWFTLLKWIQRKDHCR